jgi:hypothetical protein
MAEQLYSGELADEAKSKENRAVARAPQPEKQETLLEKLSATIAEKVSRKDIFINVPERPRVTLRISPNITQAQVRKWRKEAGEDTKNGMDATKFATFVIGHTTQGIVFSDEEVFDDNGFALNFAHDQILNMTKTTRPVPDAVRAFFGLDPHVEAAALAILDAAGFGDTIEPAEDPTKKSSTN